MKTLIKIMLLAFVPIYVSCNLHKPLGAEEINTGIKGNGDSVLRSDYFLSNRTTDCESSIRFMRSIIEPDSIHTQFAFSAGHRLGFIYFNIKGESNPKKLEKLELFFIDLDCFKQIKPLELFRLICAEEDFLQIEEEFSKPENALQRYFFECQIPRMNCFSIVINKGVVEHTNWCIHNSIG